MKRFEKIDGVEIANFVNELMDYYSKIDDNNVTIIHKSGEQKERNNAGWYHYLSGKHCIHINIDNILNLKKAVDMGNITNKDFYCFVSLIVGHEFRHFLQARYTKDGVFLDGYTNRDILCGELIIYIKMFFDRYYLLNKGFIKFEEDAEKFAIKGSLKFLKEYYPELDPEISIVRAVKYYAYLQYRAGMVSTVPSEFNSIDKILSEIDRRIEENSRIPDLSITLGVNNPLCYKVHNYYNLDCSKLFTREFLSKYSSLKDGTKQDLLVVSRILSLINYPSESLQSFSELQKIYKRR